MAREALYTPADFLKQTFDDGAEVDLGGGFALRRNNAVLDQFFQRVQEDGAPPQIDFDAGAPDDGYHVYVGVDSPRLMGRQTGEPWGPERDAWSGQQALVSGPPVPSRPSEAFGLDAVLPPLGFRFRPDAEAGFPAADYWYCVAAVTPGKAFTGTTDPVRYAHATDGAPIICPLPGDLPEGAVKWAIFLSEPGGGVATLRLQRVVGGSLTEHTLSGPYHYGRERPPRNETFVGRPRQPEYGRGRDFHVGHGHRNLRGMQHFLLSIVQVTARGRSLPSIHSEGRRIEAAKNSAVIVHPERLHPDTDAIEVYVQIGGSENPPWYQLIATHKTDKTRGFKYPRGDKEPIRVHGDVESEATATDPKARASNFSGFLLIPQDPPTEDTSGVEDPQGETELPRAGAGGRLPTGRDLYCTYTRVFGGEQTMAARHVKVRIPANQVLDLLIPPRVNLIPNAHARDRNKLGRPVGWEFALPAGAVDLKPGRCWVRSGGAVSTGTTGPDALMPFGRVLKDQVSTVRGILEVQDYGGSPGTTGFGYATVAQYAEDASGAKTEIAGARVEIGRLDRNGFKEVARFFGPAAEGGESEWHDDATHFRVVYGLGGGAGRNGAVVFHSGACHPFAGAPPRFQPGLPGEPATPTNEPTVPYHNGSLVVVTSAPTPPGSPSVSRAAQRDGFESGLPAGWAVDKLNSAGIVSQVEVAPGFVGAAYYRSQKTTTANRGHATIRRPFTDLNGRQLGERFLMLVDQLPTYPGTVRVAEIFNQQNFAIGALLLSNVGTLFMTSWDYVKNAITPVANPIVPVLGGVKAGDVLDLEILALRALSTSGELSVTAGLLDSARTTTRQGADWRAALARGLRLGGALPTDSRIRWNLRYDELIVSEFGWPGARNRTSETDPVPLPHRPWRAEDPLLSPAATGDHDFAERATASVFARVSKTANPAALQEAVALTHAASGAAGDLARLSVSSAGVPVGTVLSGPPEAVAAVSVPLNLPALPDPDDAFLEVEVEGAGTGNGWAHFYLWRGAGGPRERLASYNADFTGRGASRARFRDASGAWALSERRVFPRASRRYVEKDPDGNEVNQIVVSAMPDDSPGLGVGWGLEETFVRPGRVHTFAVEEAHDLAAPGTEPVLIECFDDAGNAQEVGSILPGGVPEGPAGRSAAWADRALAFTPRGGFYRLRTRFRNNRGGVYRFQRPGLFLGDLTVSNPAFGGDERAAQAARDALRNDERAAEATVRAVLPAEVPGKGIQDDFEETITGLASEAAGIVPPGFEVSARYRWSAFTPPPFSGPYAAASEVPARAAWVDALVTLRRTPNGGGDPRDTARIGSGGIGLSYATHRSMLCRENGTPLPGGTIVTGLVRPTPLPGYRNERPGGHSVPIPITDPITRADGLLIDFFNPEGLGEFLENQLDELWTIWHRAAGRVYLAQLDEPVEVDDPFEDVHEELRGFQYVTCAAPSFEILEDRAMELPGSAGTAGAALAAS